MANNIRLELITSLVHTGDGKYLSYPAQIFEGKSYTELGILEFLPGEPGYPAPGAIRVAAVVSLEVFLTLDNAHSGADAEGEEPTPMALVEGSVFDAETGTPVDPTEV